MSYEKITVETQVQSDLDTVWTAWTEPDHITQWNFATDEWCCPTAVNDLTPGGVFSWRMEAKDGSMGFDYAGNYDSVSRPSEIAMTLGDGRKVHIAFTQDGDLVSVIETFEAESENLEMQKQGWQAILNNFKAHVEGLKS